jgi:hypothetical protein
MTELDPRIVTGIALFNDRDYAEAADVFEELVLECVLDELHFVRAPLQVSAGAHHIERGQVRPSIERLEEGLLAIDRVRDDRGYDLKRLRERVTALIEEVRRRLPVEWPVLERRV